MPFSEVRILSNGESPIYEMLRYLTFENHWCCILTAHILNTGLVRDICYRAASVIIFIVMRCHEMLRMKRCFHGILGVTPEMHTHINSHLVRIDFLYIYTIQHFPCFFSCEVYTLTGFVIMSFFLVEKNKRTIFVCIQHVRVTTKNAFFAHQRRLLKGKKKKKWFHFFSMWDFFSLFCAFTRRRKKTFFLQPNVHYPCAIVLLCGNATRIILFYFQLSLALFLGKRRFCVVCCHLTHGAPSIFFSTESQICVSFDPESVQVAQKRTSMSNATKHQIRIEFFRTLLSISMPLVPFRCRFLLTHTHYTPTCIFGQNALRPTRVPAGVPVKCLDILHKYWKIETFDPSQFIVHRWWKS